MLLHVFLGAEHQRTRGTGLDAGWLESHRNAVGAQGAFVRLVIALGDARDVEGAAGDAVPAANAVLFVKVHDTVGVLHDRTRRRAGFQAPGVRAVHAAVLADQPLEIALGVLVFGEAHQRPGLAAEVARVVVHADVAADLIAQLVPFHARDLAGRAPAAVGRVDELGDRAGVRGAHARRGRGGRRAAHDVEGLQGHL